ncbi:MAG: Hsp20/alpha crystallin family protein [Candidatus Bathyarchaeota archaeon]|nr:Hsp20/alpha crystallin family protein [Candidatus Bathyarchaeota archaeon]MDH5787869.1 Hsp20/alpha crystallin family protein [Candidatus Bathyarchaeota archaeon]
MSPEDYPDWFRKRRYPFFRGWGFDDIDSIFREMQKMMEEEFKTFTSQVPKDYVKERKLPDGRTVREWGPFVYGYSMKIGPDGKPEVREFGNVKQSRLGPRVKEEREPLVDIIETDGEIHVVAELPGVEKKDIKLHGTEDMLTISVDTSQHKYYKEISLPAKVKVKEAKTQYKNGVLEVTLTKVKGEEKAKGEPIGID